MGGGGGLTVLVQENRRFLVDGFRSGSAAHGLHCHEQRRDLTGVLLLFDFRELISDLLDQTDETARWSGCLRYPTRSSSKLWNSDLLRLVYLIFTCGCTLQVKAQSRSLCYSGILINTHTFGHFSFVGIIWPSM